MEKKYDEEELRKKLSYVLSTSMWIIKTIYFLFLSCLPYQNFKQVEIFQLKRREQNINYYACHQSMSFLHLNTYNGDFVCVWVCMHVTLSYCFKYIKCLYQVMVAFFFSSATIFKWKIKLWFQSFYSHLI